MSENTQDLDGRSASIWPTAWKYALILAAFKVLYDLALRTTGLAGNVPGLGLIGFVVAVVLLVIALRRYRGRNAGFMTFGQGFGIAFIASVVSILITAAIGSIYLSVFGEQELNARFEETMRQVQSNPSMDAEAMEAMRGVIEAIFTPGGLFIAAVIAGTVGWAIVSLILAAVLKNPPPITD